MRMPARIDVAKMRMSAGPAFSVRLPFSVSLYVLLFLMAAAVHAQIPFDLYIDRVYPSSTNANRLYALARPASATGADYFAFRSDDAGATWLPLYVTESGRPQAVRSFAIDFSNDAVVLAGLPIANGGLRRSSDGGQTWAAAGGGLPTSGDGAIDELYTGRSGSEVYARIGDAVYNSSTGFNGWIRRGDLPAAGGILAVNLTENGGQMPLTYVAGRRVFVSRDGGLSWTEGNYTPDIGANARGAAVYAGMDAHVIAVVDPANPNLIEIRKTNRELNSFMQRTTLQATANVDRVFGQRLQNGNVRYLHYRVTQSNGQPGYCRVNDTAPSAACGVLMADSPGVPVGAAFFDRVYGATPLQATGQRALFISTDAGGTWTRRTGSYRPTLEKPAGPIQISLRAGESTTVSLPLRAVEAPNAVLAVALQVPSVPWITIPTPNQTTPAQAQVTVSTTGLAPGTHTGIVSVSAPTSANLNVNYTIELTVTSDGPVILTGGIGDAAGGGTDISPGSLFSIYGQRLAPSQQQAPGAPWPTQLNTVEVKVNGVSVPLYFVSEGQINAQLPLATATGNATVQVFVNGVASNSATATVIAAAPGIFQYGTNRAVVQHLDGSINSAQNPTRVGSIVVIYFTGIGTTTNPVPTGQAAPNAPFSEATLPVVIRVGNTVARTLFVGLTPGFIGLAQANIEIPAVEAGDRILTISIGGDISNGPLITVAP